MIKVVPYFETIGTDKFKEFLSNPFEVDMLFPVTKNISVATYFNGWKGKAMVNWYKFTDDNDNTLEFYADYYIIKKAVNKIKTTVYQLPLPRTINDFINDMSRLEIVMYWDEQIGETFEPKDYLDKNQVETYYFNLLNKIDKSNELL